MRCIFALFAGVFLWSCAHLPPPEVRCDETVSMQGPQGAALAVAEACQRYSLATEIPPERARRAMVGTKVFFSTSGLPPECGGAPGCVHIADTIAYIYVKERGWRTYLPHEIYHILLTRLEPELAPGLHHRRMRELNL